jgi:hypothetical protein
VVTVAEVVGRGAVRARGLETLAGARSIGLRREYPATSADQRRDCQTWRSVRGILVGLPCAVELLTETLQLEVRRRRQLLPGMDTACRVGSPGSTGVLLQLFLVSLLACRSYCG